MESDNLTQAKQELVEALGSTKTTKYFEILKKWFRSQSTKEEFDGKCRQLMPPGTVQFHNKFLLALLNKIGAISIPSPVPMSPPLMPHPYGVGFARKRKFEDTTIFDPVEVLDYASVDNLEYILPPNGPDEGFQSVPTQRYMAQELFLADNGFIMGRCLVGAWEVGLHSVEDKVAECITDAVQILLKNLLTAIILKRKHYKVTGVGSYFYDVGAPIKDPFNRNTVTRNKIDDSPLELDKEITSPSMQRPNNDETTFLCDVEDLYPRKNRLINVLDVYDALQDRNLIASHNVYATNMERLSQILHY